MQLEIYKTTWNSKIRFGDLNKHEQFSNLQYMSLLKNALTLSARGLSLYIRIQTSVSDV